MVVTNVKWCCLVEVMLSSSSLSVISTLQHLEMVLSEQHGHLHGKEGPVE